jgi:hypothetical protein
MHAPGSSLRDPNRACGLTFDYSKCLSHARDADVGLRAVNTRCRRVLAFHLIRIDLARVFMRWIIIAAILEETFREHLQAIFKTADRQCRWPYRRPCRIRLGDALCGYHWCRPPPVRTGHRQRRRCESAITGSSPLAPIYRRELFIRRRTGHCSDIRLASYSRQEA